MVRRYSSSDTVTPIPQPASAPVPLYWYRAPQTLSAAAGMHRFVWDVHYQPIADSGGAGGGRGGLPITAIPYNSAPAPGTPWVSPGNYRVKLTANGKTVSQSITVKQDPRVKTPALTMQQVYAATSALYFGAVDAQSRDRESRGVAGSNRDCPRFGQRRRSRGPHRVRAEAGGGCRRTGSWSRRTRRTRRGWRGASISGGDPGSRNGAMSERNWAP